VPPDQPVTVSSQVAAGEIDVLGRQSSGLQIQNTVTDGGSNGVGRLGLHLHVGLGQIRVNRGVGG
jgi:hypothetical protein